MGGNFTGTTAGTGGSLTYWTAASSTTTATANWTTGTVSGNVVILPSRQVIERIPAELPPGKRELGLPDGAKLIVDDLGNYRIEDKDATVTYQANRLREFSPHLNASDLLAQFVRYAGKLGVRQKEVLQLPIELFINWLVIEAAERDKDPVPEGVEPPLKQIALIRKPRCLVCQRFIPLLHHRNRFPFCKPEHGARHVERLALTNGGR